MFSLLFFYYSSVTMSYLAIALATSVFNKSVFKNHKKISANYMQLTFVIRLHDSSAVAAASAGVSVWDVPTTS